MFGLEELSDRSGVKLRGDLSVGVVAELERRLRDLGPGVSSEFRWDLREVEHIDTAAALVLWDAWSGALPPRLTLPERSRDLFVRLADMDGAALNLVHGRPRSRNHTFEALTNVIGVLTVFGRFVLDALLVVRHPRQFPFKELSAACFRAGVTALPIVTTVGALIGIVLSYLSSLQLRQYGGESFLPLILGIGVVRELGPMLAAIVIAGRSGSAITAGIAAMRLTEELDALSVLGVSHSLRLVFPRALALAVTLPLLVVCTNLAALAGGMVSGWVELGIQPQAFVRGLHQDVPIAHFAIGLLKSFVFGFSIGLIACYFGLKARPNTESLSTETTASVVLSISAIILLDAVFAIVFKGIPA